LTTTTDLTPPQHDLDLYRGDSVKLLYQLGYYDTADPPVFHAYDLTGVAIAAQIRAKQDDTVALVSFTIDLEDQTDPDTKGMFWVLLSSTLSASSLTATKANPWFWDLQVTWATDDVQTIEWGQVTVDKDVTRAS
jgi:hypothetical protein